MLLYTTLLDAIYYTLLSAYCELKQVIFSLDQVVAAPSRVQMMAVGSQRAFAARTAVT
jgi:hypothetical protein